MCPFCVKDCQHKAQIFLSVCVQIFVCGARLHYTRALVVPENMVISSSANVPSTWGEATQSLEMNDLKLGRVRVSLWKNLHERKTATRPMSLIRVERLDQKGCGRVSKPLWLAWVGEEMPPKRGSLATLFASLYR